MRGFLLQRPSLTRNENCETRRYLGFADPKMDLTLGADQNDGFNTTLLERHARDDDLMMKSKK